MSDLTDDQLITNYLHHRDLNAMTEIFLRYQDSAFRTAILTCGNVADAEDAVQVSFLKFMNESEQFKIGLSLKAYLMKIVVNTCKDKYKSEKRRSKRQNIVSERRPIVMQNNDDTVIDQQGHIQTVKTVLHQLPDKYQESIAMIYFEGFSYAEAADVLNIPEKTIRTQVSRGIEKIREILSGQKITLSSAAIGALLQKAPLEKASEGLKEKCLQLAYKPQNTTIINSQTSTPIMSKFIFSLAMVALIGAGAFIWSQKNLFNNNSDAIINVNSNKTNNVKDLNVDNSFDREYFFEKSDEATVISKSDGLHWLQNGGINNSGCLLFDDYILIKIPYKESDLPITISYKSNPVQTELAGGFSQCSFSSVNKGYFLAGLASMTYLHHTDTEFFAQSDEQWLSEEFVFDKNGVEAYKNGELKYVCVSRYSGAEYLLVWANHKSKIDDLKIKKGGKLKYEKYYDEWEAHVQKKMDAKQNAGNFNREFLLSSGLKGLSPVFQVFEKSKEGVVEDMLFKTKKSTYNPNLKKTK